MPIDVGYPEKKKPKKNQKSGPLDSIGMRTRDVIGTGLAQINLDQKRCRSSEKKKKVR